jgi:peptidoglycan/LPS O-acetylase OafA/YrhL
VTDGRSIGTILAASIGATALAALMSTFAWWTGSMPPADLLWTTTRRILSEFLIFFSIPVALLTWKARLKTGPIVILGVTLALVAVNQIPRLTGPNDNGGKLVANGASILLALLLAWLLSLFFENEFNEMSKRP